MWQGGGDADIADSAGTFQTTLLRINMAMTVILNLIRL